MISVFYIICWAEYNDSARATWKAPLHFKFGWALLKNSSIPLIVWNNPPDYALKNIVCEHNYLFVLVS